MNRGDPYTPTGDMLYECPSCGCRERSETRVGACPGCGGAMRNISVPRE